MEKDLLAKLQELYNAEKNFRIEAVWDSGFTAFLGDNYNGFKKSASFDSIKDCIDWLIDEGGKHD